MDGPAVMWIFRSRTSADQINDNSSPIVTGNLAWFIDYRMMEYNSDLFWNHTW